MTDQQPQGLQISVEHIEAAEQIIGLEFTEAERAQMRQGLQENLTHYQNLRDLDWPNDLPPALRFDPLMGEPPAHPPMLKRPIQTTPIGKVQRPADLEEVAFWPVLKLAELIRTRQVSSLELTQMYLERLKRYDSYLRCVITLTEERALAQASQADADIAAGNYRGPLHGIPWGAKDLLAVTGYPTTWGARPYKYQTLDHTATVVERLDAAGAVLVAKLSLGALAYGDIWFESTTKNPWNILEGSSGSSAGSASAVSAGLVGFAIGTETYGSIVSPSTRCGVTGLRPTFGRLSRHGAMALVWSMDKIGPMARTVEDCAVIFNAIYGPDSHDHHLVNQPFVWTGGQDWRQLKIGYLEAAFDEETPHQANDLAVLEVLAHLGATLHPIELPKENYSSLNLMLVAEAAAAFDELTRHNLDDQLEWQDDEAWPNTFRQARFIPAIEYIQASRLRTKLLRQMADLMRQIDVFVAPAFVGNTLLLTNHTGHPAVVLPNGFIERQEHQTPSSITFVGGLFKEAQTLALAKAYQDATTWHLQHPTLKFE